MSDLYLDFYDGEAGAELWCWKCGEWSSEEYASEFLAKQALRNGKLVFSQADEYDGYEAACVFRRSRAAIPIDGGPVFRSMPGRCEAGVGLSLMGSVSSTAFGA